MGLRNCKMSEIAPIRAIYVDRAPVYSNRGSAYSATSLLRSPRQLQLSKRHGEKVGISTIKDPAKLDKAIINRMPSVNGTAHHDYYERTLKETPWQMGLRQSREFLCEHRFFDEILDRKVSAQIDVYSYADKILYDYKVQSAYVRSIGGQKWLDKLADVEFQLNVSAYFARKEGLPVEGVACLPQYKDWHVRNTGNPNYPQTPIEQWDLRLWDMQEAEELIYSAVEDHKAHEDTPDDDLPLCSPSECWERPGACAVMKRGRKSALTKLVPQGETWDAAVDFIKKSGDKDSLYIRSTAGNMTKCSDFCDVNVFCNQYKTWLSENPKPGTVQMLDINGAPVDI